MLYASIDTIPAELAQSAQPIKEGYGEEKFAQVFKLDGKDYVYKRSQSSNWYDFRNSRDLAIKYPEVYKHRPVKEVAMEQAKSEQQMYEQFCISFGFDPLSKDRSSKGVAHTLTVVGNQLNDEDLERSTSELNQEEKDFVAVHTYQEVIREPLIETLGFNIDELTFEQYERLRTASFEDLREDVAWEGKIKTHIIEHKQALQDYYSRCAEAALCGLVPDFHIKTLFDQYGENKGIKFLGYLLTSGVGFANDGNIKFYDFDKPHFNAFDLEQKRKIREAIDKHKLNNEYAISYDQQNNPIFADWYSDLIKTLLGDRANRYLSTIHTLFSSDNMDGRPYLNSLCRLIGSQAYGSPSVADDHLPSAA